jgi:hypothetical protein
MIGVRNDLVVLHAAATLQPVSLAPEAALVDGQVLGTYTTCAQQLLSLSLPQAS